MNLQTKRIKELFGYARTLTREQGLAPMLGRAAGFFSGGGCWAKRARYWPSKRALAAQRAADTSAFPLISILTPLYNTPEPFLNAFLDSVQAQTSPRWQLVLADASDAAHAPRGASWRRRARRPTPRIVYRKIENKGIAANTNAAAALAAGPYLALADHDDLLAPHAVYEMGRAAAATGAAFLYSDEALFRKTPQRAHVAHFKPDYAPEYLMACNYICHLAVFKKSLYEQAGGERSECDGAQDPRPVPAPDRRHAGRRPGRRARASAAGAVLLARARGFHQRRHRGQTLCAAGGPPRRGGPSRRHRAAGERGARQIPRHLPCALDPAGPAPARLHSHPEQGPCGRSRNLPAQPVCKNLLRKLRGHRHREQLDRPRHRRLLQKAARTLRKLPRRRLHRGFQLQPHQQLWPQIRARQIPAAAEQ